MALSLAVCEWSKEEQCPRWGLHSFPRMLPLVHVWATEDCPRAHSLMGNVRASLGCTHYLLPLERETTYLSSSSKPHFSKPTPILNDKMSINQAEITSLSQVQFIFVSS